jgi:CRISPR-associated protein Cmr3
MRLLLEPLDVLMFRSSRPFFRGEHHIAEPGPISPLTFAGAIRTKLLLDYDPNPPKEWWKKSEFKEIAELIGSPENDGKMRILCVLLADRGKFEEYFPMPLDIVFSERNGSAMLLKPLENKIFELDTEFYSLISQSFYVDTQSLHVTREDMLRYLQADLHDEHRQIFKKTADLYEYETRAGIALNKDTKTTEEGMLYTAEFLRLRDEVGFMVWLDGIDSFPEEGLLKLGGEGRGCSYRKLEDWRLDISKVIEEANRSRRFKLYFATPTIFRKNDEETWSRPNIKMLEEKLGVKLSLISAALGKPITIGGWDAAKGRQKPLQNAVPAGAVYFLKIKGEKKLNEDLEMPLQISDSEARWGLGSAFIGVW